MSRDKILLQLDADPQPSVFDSVVAVDAEVDHLFRHGSVTVEQVRPLVYGTIFTRSPDELKSTAIFVGGSNVAAGEKLFEEVKRTFFGPMRVSVMLDPNGANTTAAAAVLAAAKHVSLQGASAVVLGGTGPVGQRAARLLAREGATVRLGSRSQEKAAEVCQSLSHRKGGTAIEPVAAATPDEVRAALEGASIVIAAGAPGAVLLPADIRRAASSLRVAIDLNAVPPVGIEGVEVMDKAADRDGMKCYGAIGVGGTKMKIHKAAVRKLFESNDQVLDAEEMLDLGRTL